MQVVSLKDNRKLSIGEKRNKLLEMATGLYTVFIDDDDWIAPTYIKSVLDALERRPDVVGIIGQLTIITNGKPNPQKQFFYHTLDNRNYRKSNRGFERPPNHLNPMRRDVAATFSFEKKNWQEDKDWAMEICREQILKTEVFIPHVIYFYDYVPNKNY